MTFLLIIIIIIDLESAPFIGVVDIIFGFENFPLNSCVTAAELA
jgi:hypothetical protein